MLKERLSKPFALHDSCVSRADPRKENRPLWKWSMNRRAFLKTIGSAALIPILPRRLWASTNLSRRRPSDATWPSDSDCKQLNEAVGGNLISVDFPLSILKTDPSSAAAKSHFEHIR